VGQGSTGRRPHRCVLIVVGMALARLFPVHELTADALIALGVAIALACRSLVQAQWAPRFFKWPPAFLFAVRDACARRLLDGHDLAGAAGASEQATAERTAGYFAMALTVVVALLVAYVFSLFTEQQTPRLRRALTRVRIRASKRTRSRRQTVRPPTPEPHLRSVGG